MSILSRVVVVSKEAEVQQMAQQVGYEIFVADDIVESLDIIETVYPDLIIFNDNFSPSHIQEFIKKTDKNSVHIPIVVIGSGEDDPKKSTEFIKSGAFDYVQGKQHYDQLKKIANRIRNNKFKVEDKNTSKFFIDDCAASIRMVGCSRAFVKTLGMIRLVAASRCNPVLIIGETGTGKELAAKAIHALRNPNERFVDINCAALTATLLESELFGHVKGSFTGADRDKTGLLELAGKGTVFLDEISEMPLEMQAKLLRVLQEKTFRKVGGTKNITCCATIITSSNRNLYKEMKAHRFRRDLYYRLNICPVIIAALKSPDRKEDIALLAEYFLKTSTMCPEKNKRISSFTKFALEALREYDWPGNVRELRNVIDRALLLETTDKIGLSSIVLNPTECSTTEIFPDFWEDSAENERTSEDGPVHSVDLSARKCPVGRTYIKDFSLEKAERELVARALAETGWQKTQAAALLGITRATLYAKVKQYNIKKESPVRRSGRVINDFQDHVLVPSSHQPVMAS